MNARLPSDYPGKLWATFTKSKPNEFIRIHQALQAAHDKDYSRFERVILQIDGAAPVTRLWIDVQDMMHPHDHTDHGSQKHTPQHTGHDEEHPHTSNHGGSDAERIKGLFDLFDSPQIVEFDEAVFEKTNERLEAWEKQHQLPKNASAAEQLAHEQKYIDFYYGDLDDPKSLSLEQQEVKAFENEYKNSPDTKKAAKWAKYERYRKTPQENFSKDQEIEHLHYLISEEISTRYSLLAQQGLEEEDLEKAYILMVNKVRQKKWDHFFETHREKAAAYAHQSYTAKDTNTQKELEAFRKEYSQWQQRTTGQQTAPAAQPTAASSPSKPLQTPPSSPPVAAPSPSLIQQPPQTNVGSPVSFSQPVSTVSSAPPAPSPQPSPLVSSGGGRTSNFGINNAASSALSAVQNGRQALQAVEGAISGIRTIALFTNPFFLSCIVAIVFFTIVIVIVLSPSGGTPVPTASIPTSPSTPPLATPTP